MRPAAVAVLLLALLAAGVARAAPGPVVVLDPGHDLRANLGTEPIGPGATTRKIKDGGGTRGIHTGLTEARLNLRIAQRLRTLLRRAGVRVVLTRTRTARTSMGNVARARIANRAGAALFLRIHADGVDDRSARGTHTLVPALRRGWTDDIHRASARAGRIVQRALVAALGLPDRGVRERSDFTGFNWADVPVLLVEVGFLTNRDDERLLASPAGARRAAFGLCRGTLAFLGRTPRACGGKGG